MKRVSRWLAGVCIAALLFGAAGMESIPAKAANPSLQIETPENRVQTYQCGEAQDFVLNIINTGDTRLSNITVSPKLKEAGAEWPFKTDYQSYHESLESREAGETGSYNFNFMQRYTAGDYRYLLRFF